MPRPSDLPGRFGRDIDHLPSLDGLRGIAILLVLWAHLPDDLFGALGAAINLFAPGYLGVDVFFVLSGFLITRILLHARAQGLPLRRFFWRRSWRIFPIYYLTILAVWLLAPGDYVWQSAIYIQNFTLGVEARNTLLNHTWSLAVEEHFYLLWPLIVYRLPVSLGRVVVTVLVPLSILFAVLTLLWLDYEMATRLIYRGTHCRMLSLSLGALMAYRELAIHGNHPRVRAVSLALFVGGNALRLLGNLLVPAFAPVTRMVGFSSLSCAVVLLAITYPRTKMLTGPCLTGIGKISYGLYLYHHVIYVWLGMRWANDYSLTSCVLAVSLSFCVAILSYVVIEKPLLRIKDELDVRRPRTSRSPSERPSPARGELARESFAATSMGEPIALTNPR